MAALIGVATASSHELAIPALVLEESVSIRRRGAASAFEALTMAHRRASRFSDSVATYIPSVEEVADEWRTTLEGIFAVLKTPGDAAVEALRREAHRLPPARNGKGARDAAIWLTTLEHCGSQDQVTYFVSENTADFADPNDKGVLHPELAAECTGLPFRLVFRPSVDSVLSDLAALSTLAVDVNSLLTHPTVQEAIRRSVDLDLLPRLVVKRSDTRTVVGGDSYATSGYVLSQLQSTYFRAYDVGETTYALITFDVQAVARVGILARRKSTLSETILPVTFRVVGKAWVSLSSDEANVAAAEVSGIDRWSVDTPDTEFEVSCATNAVRNGDDGAA